MVFFHEGVADADGVRHTMAKSTGTARRSLSVSGGTPQGGQEHEQGGRTHGMGSQPRGAGVGRGYPTGDPRRSPPTGSPRHRPAKMRYC